MFSDLSNIQKNFLSIIGFYVLILAVILFATKIVAPVKNHIWIIIGVLLAIQFSFFVLSLIFIKNQKLEKVFWLIFNFFTFITVSALLFNIYIQSIEYCFNYQSVKNFTLVGYFLLVIAILSLIGLKFLISRVQDADQTTSRPK